MGSIRILFLQALDYLISLEATFYYEYHCSLQDGGSLVVALWQLQPAATPLLFSFLVESSVMLLNFPEMLFSSNVLQLLLLLKVQESCLLSLIYGILFILSISIIQTPESLAVIMTRGIWILGHCNVGS